MWKAISLFSGAGGDTLGMEQAGIKVVGFVEFDKWATETHLRNFKKSILIGKKYHGYITKIPDNEFKKFENKIDIIFAGFPCQAFSHAGKKDPKDKRVNLFKEFVRIVKIVKPKWIIGENVEGILERKDIEGNKNMSKIINKSFKDIGYTMIKPKLISAENYKTPQLRKRVFL